MRLVARLNKPSQTAQDSGQQQIPLFDRSKTYSNHYHNLAVADTDCIDPRTVCVFVRYDCVNAIEIWQNRTCKKKLYCLLSKIRCTLPCSLRFVFKEANNMRKRLAELWADRRGETTEYAVMAALAAIGLIGVYGSVGPSLKMAITSVSSAMMMTSAGVNESGREVK